MNYTGLFFKKFFRFLLKPLSFVPAILVACMIFNFSAQDSTDSSALSQQVTESIVHSVNYRLNMNWTPEQQQVLVDKAEFYVRKTAHFSEYCLFAITISLPLYVYGVRGFWLFFWTVLICFGYACTDEYHQTFSSGRSPQFRDVLIDTSGGLLGTLIAHPVLVLFRKTIFKPLSLEKEREMKRQYEEEQEEIRERQRQQRKQERHRPAKTCEYREAEASYGEDDWSYEEPDPNAPTAGQDRFSPDDEKHKGV